MKFWASVLTTEITTSPLYMFFRLNPYMDTPHMHLAKIQCPTIRTKVRWRPKFSPNPLDVHPPSTVAKYGSNPNFGLMVCMCTLQAP